MEMLIELERALELVLSRIRVVATEQVPLINSYHRVLAAEVYSPLAMPPFDRSPLDGYSYRAEELTSGVLHLNVVSEVPAGTWPEREIAAGEAAKIFTGAPIPVGANCVVRVEDTETDGNTVTIRRPVLPGANVVPSGDEIQKGDTLLKAGTVLSAPAVGLLAAAGVNEVEVYRRPLVGIISTGTELMDVGRPLAPGKIYNSNSYTLRGLIQEIGCDVKVVPFVPDSLPETLQALEELSDTDLVVSTGGASVGDYDLMRQGLEEFGCNVLFWKINMKPGTPASVAIKDDKQMFFSLSGNPAAAMVTFELLVRPALRKCMGCLDWQGPEFLVKMAGGFKKSGRQRRFLRAKAVYRDGEIWADLSPAQGSGILRSMIGSDLLVDVPAGHGIVQEGEYLKARWI